jgi:hypothetical protein
MPKGVDFANFIIEVTGDKSIWAFSREGRNRGKFVLQKKAEIQRKHSSIPIGTEFRGNSIIITQIGVALFQGKKLIIDTAYEYSARIAQIAKSR